MTDTYGTRNLPATPGVFRDEDEQMLNDEWRLLILSDDAKDILSQNVAIDTDTKAFWSKIWHTEVPTDLQTCWVITKHTSIITQTVGQYF